MENLGKREKLRSGEIVELKPGLHGRLNKENRTLELDSGKVLPISESDQRDLFPENEQALDVARRTEKLGKTVKEYPIVGEFLFQMGQSSGISGIKDTVNYFTKSVDDYLKDKEAERRISSRISKESPWTSTAATAASFIPDIYATKGMSALKAAPLISTVSAGSRAFTEPGQVAEEALLSAAGGKLIDVGGNFLSKIAKRRGESRAMIVKQAETRTANILGKEAQAEANVLQKEEFNTLFNRTENENAARLHQYNLEVNSRSNKLIQDRNEFLQKKAARDSEVIRLKNEYEIAKSQRSAEASRLEQEWKSALDAAKKEERLANEKFKLDQSAYNEELKKMPQLQREAQSAYSEGVVRNAQKISDSFPKESKIYSDSFGTNEFIEDSIKKSGLAGSAEGNKAQKIIKSIFQDGEILSGNDLANRYKALESAIQKSSPEIKKVLTEYKNYLGNKLPTILADNMAYKKIVGIEKTSPFKNQIQKEVESAIKTLRLPIEGMGGEKYVLARARSTLDNTFRNINSQDFIKKWETGEIKQQILNSLSREDFMSGYVPKKGIATYGLPGENIVDPYSKYYTNFLNDFSPKLDKILAKSEVKLIATDIDAAKRLGGKVKATYGMAEPVPMPKIPKAPEQINFPTSPNELPNLNPPQFPSQINPAEIPLEVPRSNLMGKPISPINQPFISQPEPNLASPQGFAEQTGDLLEKNLMGGKGMVNNPIAKLAGLKYLLGSSALPAEAAYLGMKGLTSPSIGVELARMTFKQGGIKAVESWAQKYPSYHDGILESPQERRSLTKEIEDAQDIPIEQKAVIQSKVNRGKPLSHSL